MTRGEYGAAFEAAEKRIYQAADEIYGPLGSGPMVGRMYDHIRYRRIMARRWQRIYASKVIWD